MSKTLCRAALLALSLLLAPAAQAQLYRCPKAGGIVYSETPCAPNAERKQLDGQAPSAEDAAAARLRASRDRVEDRGIERQRAQDQIVKDAYAAQSASQQAARKRRCEQHLANAEDAKRWKDVYVTDRFRNMEDARRKASEDAHFSECYGSNTR